MPLSKDPVRRAKQLDNLRPAGAVKHGATSEGKLAPLRAHHRSPPTGTSAAIVAADSAAVAAIGPTTSWRELPSAA